MRRMSSGREGEKFIPKTCFLEELKGFPLCGCAFECLCEDKLFTELL